MYSAYNYYTKVKGRKFQIPFFDDDFLSSQFAPSSVKNPEELKSNKELALLATKGGASLALFNSDLQNDPEIIALVKK